MTVNASAWWDRQRHADRRPLLLCRNRIQAEIRDYFQKRDFVEVACGQVAISPGNEAHLHAFPVEAIGTDMISRNLFLHTSPEFAAKKLLAAGETRIFDFARVFRNRERGPLHAPEFTMLEWYRANEPYEITMADAVNILRLASEIEGDRRAKRGGRSCDPFLESQRISLSKAFWDYARIDLDKLLTPDGEGLRAPFARAATDAGVKVAADDTWSDIFSRVIVERIEPQLGFGAPTVLDRYPRCEAALARACPDDAKYAERFELYACGVELANGFGELTDPQEQRRRFQAEMDEKQRVYGERYPIDEDFLAALAQMPPASGVALGFDRLVMLVTGARHIDDVLWTPFP